MKEFRRITYHSFCKLFGQTGSSFGSLLVNTKNNPIGVAEYQIQSKLPTEFRDHLPSPEQLTDAVRDLLLPEK